MRFRSEGWALALILASIPTVAARAGDFRSSAKGTTTAGFLKLGVGARAMAMGEAYSAVADEASALYWNPAGLTQVERRSAIFMHAAHIDSSFFDYGAYAHSLGERGALGVGLQYLSAGKLAETDPTGTEIGKFTPYDLAFSVGYARKLGGYSAGFAAKFIRSKLIATAETVAADIGILSPAYLGDRLRFAATAVNLGGKMKFEQESEHLPSAFRLGSSYRFSERWLAGLDVSFPRDNKPIGAVGTEYILPVGGEWKLAGRAGYNSRTLGDIDGFTGVSFGLGWIGRAASIDYAFLPFGSVGLTHRVSLSFRF